MAESLGLLGAWLCSVVGMAWLALSLKAHWEQVRPKGPRPRHLPRTLRVLGALAHAASLGVCLLVDHASIAALVWAMLLTAAAFLVAFTLSWRPHWLRWAVAWVPQG